MVSSVGNTNSHCIANDVPVKQSKRLHNIVVISQLFIGILLVRQCFKARQIIIATKRLTDQLCYEKDHLMFKAKFKIPHNIYIERLRNVEAQQQCLKELDELMNDQKIGNKLEKFWRGFR